MNKLKKEAVKIIVGFLPENEIRGLREMFHSIDADGSGTITVTELREALRAKGTKIPDSDLTRLMNGTDVNGDGTIDYNGARAACGWAGLWAMQNADCGAQHTCTPHAPVLCAPQSSSPPPSTRASCSR